MLFPLDDLLKASDFVIAYLRWSDDLGIGVRNKAAVYEALHLVEAYSRPRGLHLHRGKTDIFDGVAFRMLGDASGVDLEAEGDTAYEWDGPAFLSRAGVRAAAQEVRNDSSDLAVYDFARRAPRMLTDPRAIERTLRGVDDPIPSELASAVVGSYAAHFEKIQSVGTAGDLLLRMTAKGKGVESSPELRRGLQRLTGASTFNQHGRASAAWMSAETFETVDKTLLSDAERFAVPTARAVYGAGLRASAVPEKGLWKAMSLSPPSTARGC